ncbi:hypothetical protein [Arthrobacter sp. UYCu712]|uniref:hypothetical protein n=1 Tax=Arthrobacter sp. UYCu712 TaxID=3156340 RepID=UPI003393B69F
MPLTTRAFNLPDHLTPKSDPTLIAGDEQHFAEIAESLEQTIADLSDRLDATRKAPARFGQEALERDVEIRRLTARPRALRRFGLASPSSTDPRRSWARSSTPGSPPMPTGSPASSARATSDTACSGRRPAPGC